MADFTTLYSGKGLSAPLPSDGGRATSRLSDFIVQAEEIKYKAFKENEQEFLKNSNIDPVFLVSTKNRDAQMDMLNAFNQKWAQKFKESGYNLSTEDKKALLTEKNFLLANQQDMQAKQDLWLQHRNMIMQNPNKFDAEEWATHDANYRVSGEYDLVAPPIKARSLDMALEENPINSAAIPGEDIQETRSGIKGVRAVTYGGTEEQGRKRVADMILSDEAYAKDISKQFMALDEATKLQYLDADKNGAISPDERKNFNPIIKWAQDTKWQKGVKQNLSQWRAIPGQTQKTSTQGQGTFSKVAELAPGERVGYRTYGGKVYNNPFGLDGSKVLYGIPTAGANILTGEWADAVDPGSVNVRLVAYDPEKKVILAETTSGSESAMTASKVLLEIPQQNVPNFENIPIIEGGNRMTIGQLPQTTTTTTPVKKRFNAVTGKFE
jgi:hypothetical protein